MRNAGETWFPTEPEQRFNEAAKEFQTARRELHAALKESIELEEHWLERSLKRRERTPTALERRAESI